MFFSMLTTMKFLIMSAPMTQGMRHRRPSAASSLRIHCSTRHHTVQRDVANVVGNIERLETPIKRWRHIVHTARDGPRHVRAAEHHVGGCLIIPRAGEDRARADTTSSHELVKTGLAPSTEKTWRTSDDG